MFKKIRNRSLLHYFKPEDKNESSVLALHDDVDKFNNRIKKDIEKHKDETRHKVNIISVIGGISVIAVVVALIAIILTHFYWQEGKFSTVNDKYEHVKNELAEKVLTHVKKESEFTKNEIAVINKSLQDISNRQDISQESIKEIQDTLLKFENLFKQMESESSKNSEGLNTKS